MRPLIETAAELHRFLLRHRRDYCCIGGLAVQHWGEPRVTLDVDLTVFTGFGNEAACVDELLSEFAPRIDDARDFALTNRVLLIRSQSGIPIDLSLAALPFEQSAIERAVEVEMLPGLPLRLCTPEDLIVFKAFADRPRDWRDVETVLQRQGPDTLDWTYIELHLGELAALKEQPDILDRLKQLRGQA